jgi:hypothetical protein
MTLGGEAARYGLSCESCHRGGRANALFFMEGLSGAPGTADVTSALFSKAREDGVFNPRPIPDLAGAGAKAALGSDGRVHSLESFIGAAVTEEFQGQPTESVIAALAAYVGALDPEACRAPERAGAARALSDFSRALAAADEALARDETSLADSLILAALQDLKRLDERYRALPASSALLRSAAAEISIARQEAWKSRKAGGKALQRFRARLPELARALSQSEADSLYDEPTLAAHLDDRP